MNTECTRGLGAGHGPSRPGEVGVGAGACGEDGPHPGSQRQRPTCAHACTRVLREATARVGRPSAGPAAGEPALRGRNGVPRCLTLQEALTPPPAPLPASGRPGPWVEGRAPFWLVLAGRGAVGSAASSRAQLHRDVPCDLPCARRGTWRAPPGGRTNSSLIRPEAPHRATQGDGAERDAGLGDREGRGGRRGSGLLLRPVGKGLAWTVCVWRGTGCGAVRHARRCGGDPGGPPAPRGSGSTLRSLHEPVNRGLASTVEPRPPGPRPLGRPADAAPPPGPADADGHFCPPRSTCAGQLCPGVCGTSPSSRVLVVGFGRLDLAPHVCGHPPGFRG